MKIPVLWIFLLLHVSLTAQVSISSSGSAPDPAAMLDVQSFTKGFLPPRMTMSQLQTIPSPPEGLFVYCTDGGANGNGAFMGYLNGAWVAFTMCPLPAQTLSGSHQPFATRIIWNWLPVAGASGYRWNTVSDFTTSVDIGNATTRTETGLNPLTPYTRFLWAVNPCGASPVTMLSSATTASGSQNDLSGYWHNWNDYSAPYIPLPQVDSRYSVVNVAFAIPHAGTDYQMEFIPDQVSSSVFAAQVQTLQNEGRRVVISIGGATAPISLDNTTERDIFISTMNTIISTYHFDGIDIDLEGSSLSISGGTIANPTDPEVINLIYAIRQIMSNFRATRGTKMWLSFAPETAFVQGGMAAYGGIWGAYLPVLHALRDSTDILHVQLYNSGSMPGINGNYYSQGTADFIVAMSEAVIHGFNTPGGYFNGFPASKVSAGLPACSSAAGGGFTNTATVKAAVDYLRGTGPKPGTYTLVQTGGYPDYRGMMTWSVNWDAVSTCGTVYEFAGNYVVIFGAK
jgi:chitinase